MFQHHIDLKSFHSFKFDCVAQDFCTINNKQDRDTLCQQDIDRSSVYILGGGTNTFFTQTQIQTQIIYPQLFGIQAQQGLDYDLITVGASQDWSELVRWTIDQGYYGLENLIDIPGNVGSSPIQNIGAYGMEVADRIHSITYWHRDGRTIIITCNECQFGYRDSIFKTSLANHGIIAAVTFALPRYNPRTYTPLTDYRDIQHAIAQHQLDSSTLKPGDIADIISTIRTSKLPDRRSIGTAGSFFKNPLITLSQYTSLQQDYPDLVGYEHGTDSIKLSAGQLIELCGYKGYQSGGVGVYDRHALVLIHYGGANPEQLLQLIHDIQTVVNSKFSVLLEPEVRFVS